MDLNVQAAQQTIQRDSSFLSEVVQASGETIPNCFQCQKCSAGCPVAFAMDILPNQILRHIQYGHREKVLSSKTIWICAFCYTCSVRCPNNIDIARIMDALRNLALRSGVELGEKHITIFHSLFLNVIKTTGRMHELALLALLKLKTRDLFKDAMLGWQMYRRGKIRLLPKFGGGKEFRDLFNEYKKEAKR